MNIFTHRLIPGVTALTALLLAFAITACGGEDITCGENTVAENGSCVPNTSDIRNCGPGTQVTADGACVISSGGCGDSLAYDSELGRCVPGSSTCADGTEFNAETGKCVGVLGCGPNTVQNNDGTCVADVGALCASQPGVTFDPEAGNCRVGTSACGPGTRLSAESGNCVISDAACGSGLSINDQGNCVPTDQVCGDQATLATIDGSQVCVPSATCQQGDVVLQTSQSTQGVCVSPAEKLANNPDVRERENTTNSEFNNDPSFNGATLQSLAVQPAGQTSAAVGTIQSQDFDGDGNPDQDIDGFRFRADPGTWLNISVQSLGLPQPWFRISGPEGFERQAPVGLQADAVRQLVTPFEGTYTIEVLPTAAATASGDAGPFGNPDWQYVLAIEQLDVPSPIATDFTASDATGSLATLTDNLFSIDGFSQGDIVELSLDSVGGGGAPIIEIWRNPTTLITTREVSRGDSVVFAYPGSSSPLLLVDWKSATSSSLDFTVSGSVTTNVENLGTLAADQQVTSTPRTISASNDEIYNYTVTVQGGEVIELTHLNDDDEEAEVTVTEIGNGEIFDDGFLDPRNDYNRFDNDEGYFYVDQTSDLLISVESDSSSTDLTNFELRVNSITPNPTVQNLQAGNVLVENVDSNSTANRTEWHQFSTVDTVEFRGLVEKLAPTGSSPDFELVLYTANESRELDFDDILSADNDGDVIDLIAETDFIDRALPTGNFLIGIRTESTPLEEYRFDLNLPGYFRESEPNDSQSAANSFPLNRSGIAVATPNNDDYFNVTLNSPLGPQELLILDAIASGSDINDWRCNALDSSGNVVVDYERNESGGDGGDQGCILFVRGASAGTYTFEIKFTGFNETDYILSAQRVDGIFEAEPNDDRTSNATEVPLSDFSSGTPFFGDANTGLSEGDTDYFQITSSGGSVSEFDIACTQIGPDPNEASCFFGFCFGGLSYALLDSSGGDIDTTDNATNYTMNTGTITSSDLPLYVEITNADDFSDNQYRCSYQTP